MAKKMSRAECWEFMMAQPHTGKLATMRPDGRPHVVPIWFERDGEQIVTLRFDGSSGREPNLQHIASTQSSFMIKEVKSTTAVNME